MKTARFQNVVAKCGKPEAQVLLTEPAKDRELQAAIRAKRVMTVFQEAAGKRADRGMAGFEAGPGRSYLIFPKPIGAFEGRTIVGIRYDLLSEEAIPKAERYTPAPKPPREKVKPPEVSVPAPPAVKEAPAAGAKASPPVKARLAAPGKNPAATKKAPAAAAKIRPAPMEIPTAGAKIRAAGGASAGAKRSEPKAGEAESADKIKKKVRRAMALLKKGRNVAAFDLLQEIAGE